ncbi:DUF6515 family protein [Dinghuibacter silviterrae]|uniref:Uncharacterized protein n=1 Tax=Dinghuibacter silviterrae TaxID=1539049 RepID=A0A4V3GLY8_9BACT|nr:DUF6515 family protein [Dinghuibacter silviterrae]TDX01303.1 hypothetical protein EDB95_2336 [Dinghuibacter silviterrae]
MSSSTSYIRMAAGAVLLLLACLPRYTQAQRFGHSNFGGGGGRPAPAPAPAYHPAPAPAYRPAPAQQQPQQQRPVEPAGRPNGNPEVNRGNPQPEARSINGGAWNVGNHDYGRGNAPTDNRPAPRPVVPPTRGGYTNEHVNVYHTGGYRSVHPYFYHPYRPFYWGPRWHPVGFFLGAMMADAFYFSFGGQPYYYDQGVYYQPDNGGYVAVAPPVGAIVNALPEGYETTQVGDQTYYYFGGAFYVYTDQGYQVVDAPPGAVITELPTGAVQQDIDGQTFLVYNNVYYEPISQDGSDAYEVVQMGN